MTEMDARGIDEDSVDCSIRGDAIKSGEGIGRCGVDESTAELMCGISGHCWGF